MKYEKETRRPPETSRKQSDHDFYLDLGFTSSESYLKKQSGITPAKTNQKSLFDPDYDPAENQRIYFLEWIEQKIKNFDTFEALDITREKIDESLLQSFETVMDLVIQLNVKLDPNLDPKKTVAHLFLHLGKGAAPYLIPMVWMLLGQIGFLIFIILNLPNIKNKLLPLLGRSLNEFWHDIKEIGLLNACIKFLESLRKLAGNVYDYFSDRLKNAKSVEETEEILGELVGLGIILIPAAGGAVVTGVQNGKAILKLPGKIPSQYNLLKSNVSQSLESLQKQLGREKFAEFMAKVAERAKRISNRKKVLKNLEGKKGSEARGSRTGKVSEGKEEFLDLGKTGNVETVLLGEVQQGTGVGGKSEAGKALIDVLKQRNALVSAIEEAGFNRLDISKLQKNKVALKEIRRGYNKENISLARLRRRLLDRNLPKESIAKITHGQRRSIGKKYKDLTPGEIAPLIYERNIKRYGDALGPTFERLYEDLKLKGISDETIFEKIINSSTKTNEALNRFIDLL